MHLSWLEHNEYVEGSNKAHSQTIKQEYDQIPQEEKTTLTDTLKGQTTLFDYI